MAGLFHLPSLWVRWLFYSQGLTTVDCHSVTYLLCYVFTMRHKCILPMIILWLTIFPGAGFEHWALVPLGLRPAATQNFKTQRANPLGYTHLMIAVCVCDVHVWISTINGCQLFRGRFDRNTLQHSPTFSNDVLHRSNGYQIDHTWTTNHHESTRWDSKCLVLIRRARKIT